MHPTTVRGPRWGCACASVPNGVPSDRAAFDIIICGQPQPPPAKGASSHAPGCSCKGAWEGLYGVKNMLQTEHGRDVSIIMEHRAVVLAVVKEYRQESRSKRSSRSDNEHARARV